MATNSSLDYKKLFLEEQERRKKAEEREKQAEEGQKQAEEGRKQAEERRKQAEERRKQAEEQGKWDRERNRHTTFLEFIRLCHDLLSRPLRVALPSLSTTGKIPSPTGKYCPTRLALWTDCSAQQQKIYTSVCNYLQPAGAPHARFFTPLNALEESAKQFSYRVMSSEQATENYERNAVENYVRNIIEELCKIDAARQEFGLGDGIHFENHTNLLDADEGVETTDQPSKIEHPKADSFFFIHRVEGDTHTLLASAEYKPPHKLSVEDFHLGLVEMDLYKDIVRSNKIPTDKEEKLKYDAKRLVCSAIVQEYHVMIQEGLEYSYVTTGIARVLLRVPRDNPSTLYYHFCDPNSEVDPPEAENRFQEPKTSIARVLCLCLMAFRSSIRDQEWRQRARQGLQIWDSNLSRTRSELSKESQPLPNSSSTYEEYTSPESGSAYEPDSSPPGPVSQELPSEGRRVSTRTRGTCAPPNDRHRTQSPDSSGSDSSQATGRKRGFSQVTSSPSTQRAARQDHARRYEDSQSRRDAQFCTQRCLFGLQTGGNLDDNCPNVNLHRRGQDNVKHLITSEDLVRLLNEQLDDNIDRCIPFGRCGSYGAPFKLTCIVYGYTVVGKGTTSNLWKQVSSEAQVYRILRKAQGSAVPVFLGTIDLAKIYFLHRAGEICHMLIMGWGGENTAEMEMEPWLSREIQRSTKEIEALGVIHDDLRYDNILWNKELGRALIIDFHRATLNTRPLKSREKRKLPRSKSRGVKRLRLKE
ncbi:uncharacterized protein N7500_008827 [Penicillium coprophilum]|uniref:uncharacterized protein n=1 Tax=Penicillium coprophilum TaxID=36646 RepID=UPI0023A4AA0F|nr:uncharacterized protein N7500_008827 [Penicillium coprophilum]KAJ5159176.1 hypothetical protein N7500_008827 [Penicillium coprophilum]